MLGRCLTIKSLNEIEKIDAGEPFSREKIVELLCLDPKSGEAQELNELAFKIGLQAAKGKMRIFGQIGLDDSVCAENCAYCSFAIDNFQSGCSGAGLAEKIREHNKHSVIDESLFRNHLRAFGSAQVNAVSLMGTASLPFSRFLDFIKIARNELPEHVGIIANYRDMNLSEVVSLKDAGVTCAYHTVRVREGKITNIDPNKRRATISAIKQSGLDLMNGVEPIWEPFDKKLAEDVAESILEAVSQEPFATGVCGLCEVENSKFKGKSPTEKRVQLVASVLRIVAGNNVEIGCVGSVKWVDAGSDPRERGYADSEEHIIREVEKARSELQSKGWLP